MNSTTKEDVMAEVVLRDLKKRERLLEIIRQPGYQYYIGGSVLGLVSALCSATFFGWLLMRENVPSWGLLIAVVSLSGLLEATRQRDRFNALLELNHIEKQEANKS